MTTEITIDPEAEEKVLALRNQRDAFREAKPNCDRVVFIPGGGSIPHCGVADINEVGGLNMFHLAELHRNPDHPMNEVIDGECSQGCGTKLRMSRFWMPKTACDECRAKAIEDAMNDECRKEWERVCPKQLRDTDSNHPGFPKHIYRENIGYDGNSSLFLFGPTGSGKSRCGSLLMKRALMKRKTVNFLWPEELKAYAKSNNERLKFIREYGSTNVLLMDDALLTGAQDERIADFLKDLIDFMQRHGNQMIITSQIGGEDYEEQANKFGNITKTDRERIDALMRRIRESFKVIPFVASSAPENKEMF